MTNLNEPKIGDKVTFSGYEGTIILVHVGQLTGMVDVRLDSGAICVDLKSLVAG